MSIIRKAFKIFNGSAWDEYHLKTDSKQVVHTKKDGTDTTVEEQLNSLNSALTWSNWISLGQNALGIWLAYRYNAFEVEVNYRGNLKANMNITASSKGYVWSGFPENLKPQYNFEAPMYAVAGNNSQLSFRCFPSDGTLSITSHYNVKTTEEYISGYYRWTRKL